MGKKKSKKMQQLAAAGGRHKAAPAAAAAASNPFEMRFNRRKHEVLGQVLKGATGKRGQARERANKLRERTLGVEYAQRHKVNQFLDQRFGEYNPVSRRRGGRRVGGAGVSWD